MFMPLLFKRTVSSHPDGLKSVEKSDGRRDMATLVCHDAGLGPWNHNI
jgi:hypothetical protein